MMRAMRRHVAALVALLAFGVGGAFAAEPAKGTFLVASRQVADSNFFQTVVLLATYSEEGAMGLIVNRPTPLELAKMLPHIEGMAERTDLAHFGGPVEKNKMVLLIRGSQQFEEAEAVLPDVQMSASGELLERLIAEGAVFRAYAGYAGWGPGQLEAEIDRGDWTVVPATSAAVFSDEPESLWDLLIKKAEVRFARLPAPPAKSQARRGSFASTPAE